MALELAYTSASRGLFPGTSGFCTVGMTEGMPKPFVEFLESLSNNYRELGNGRAEPVAISFVKGRAAGSIVRVLSRNVAAPKDYTGRTNNFAQHAIVDTHDRQAADNPAIAARTDLFATSWDGIVGMSPARKLPPSSGPTATGTHWQRVAGDAMWAKSLVDVWLGNDDVTLYIIYPPEIDLLPLLAEAIARLPADRRWDATFTTYYTSLPVGVTCAIRGVIAGSEQEALAKRSQHLDLQTLHEQPAPQPRREQAMPAVAGGYTLRPEEEADPFTLSHRDNRSEDDEDEEDNTPGMTFENIAAIVSVVASVMLAIFMLLVWRMLAKF